MKYFGQFLVGRGLVSREAVHAALLRQRETIVPLGRLAVEDGLLTREQVRSLRVTQRRLDRKMGEIALDREWLTPPQLTALLKAQEARRVLLGELLVQMGELERAALDAAAAEFDELQRQQASQLEQLIDASPQADVIRVLLDYTAKHFLRSTWEPVKIGAIVLGRPLIAEAEEHPVYFVSQSASGDGHVTFGLLLDEPMMLFIASRMLDSERRAVDDMVVDSLRELVNMIVGNCFARLSQDGFRLRPRAPVVAPAAEASMSLGDCTQAELLCRRGAFDAVVSVS